VSPLGDFVASWLHPLVLSGSLFVGWWAVWFTLGREFLQTLYMSVAARAVSIVGAWGLLASGALGTGPVEDASTGARVAACAALVLGAWAIEATVLALLMKRLRSNWRWDVYDLAVLGAAQLSYAGGAWLLGR